MHVSFRSVSLIPSLAVVIPVAAAQTDYLREVKPILAEHCYKCHGASQQKGGLRLDTAAFARTGGEHGPAFRAGQPGQDSLLLQAVEGRHAEISRMPYKKPPLTQVQIARLRSWIDDGAAAPVDEAPETARHWAFLPPERATPPALHHPPSAIPHPIDRFIMARLETEGITPSPEADRVTLIRRVTLDLLGLPPTIEEIEAFINDSRPDAYERAVERLLASPHYGERWGRWWLDVARYADSNGYSIDAPRQIWKYRDWVIQALNRDLPFDTFITWQLAGDLVDTNSLPPGAAPLEPVIATGFHRNTQINQEGGIDPEQFRVESVVDRVNTTAAAFLGITFGCAQCHDHKFDPFTQRDYYRMFAFFNSAVEDGHGKGTPGGVLEIPGEFAGDESIVKELEEAEAELDRYLNTRGNDLQRWEQNLTAEERAKLKTDVRKALDVPFATRTLKQKRSAYLAFQPDDPEFKSRHSKVARLEKREPKPVTTLVLRELDKPRETHILIKGDFTRPGERVTPGVPAALPELPPREKPTRLDLARWIVAAENPLTARVIVNRVWQQYFGRGLVETENDFGTQGIPPSHPQLLDWLAREFMAPEMAARRSRGGAAVPCHHPSDQRCDACSPRPWSLKHVHRLMVTSATYRRSSHARPDLQDKDPNNRLLARQTRLRLDAEVVRDVLLAASGLLSDKMGGPPVYPPQPAGVMNLGQSKREWKSSTGEDRRRRGVYTWFWRATPHPALAVFDAPDAFSTCTRRIRSNTPLQALTLLNDLQFYEMAEALAGLVLKLELPTDDERLDYVFRRCLGRRPDPGERRRLRDLMSSVATDAAAGREAWVAVARVLLNLDEAITRE